MLISMQYGFPFPRNLHHKLIFRIKSNAHSNAYPKKREKIIGNTGVIYKHKSKQKSLEISSLLYKSYIPTEVEKHETKYGQSYRRGELVHTRPETLKWMIIKKNACKRHLTHLYISTYITLLCILIIETTIIKISLAICCLTTCVFCCQRINGTKYMSDLWDWISYSEQGHTFFMTY